MICQNCGDRGCGYCRKDTDTALSRALYPRPGDLPEPGPSRWGNVQLLSTRHPPLTLPTGTKSPGDKYAFVATGPMPADRGAFSRAANITAMAYELRFSLASDGQIFSPTVPASLVGATVQVDIIKMIDVKSVEMRETYIINPGQPQQSCTFLALAVQIVITLLGEDQDLWVQCVAAPVQTLDCDDATGAPPGGVLVEGYANSNAERFDVAAIQFPGSVSILFPNPVRRQFYVQNNSDTDVALLFSPTEAINWTPGTEQFSIIIPGGDNLVYESFVGCYTGRVVASARPGAVPVGYLSVTEGTP
jgi:hypothetical protein